MAGGVATRAIPFEAHGQRLAQKVVGLELVTARRAVEGRKAHVALPAGSQHPEQLSKEGTGLRPNVEYLLALRPDLVVSRGSRAASDALADSASSSSDASS